jgi:4-hydroxybenzoyl-CoA reductase beta subunit
MRLPRLEHLEPKTIPEACTFLDQYTTQGAKILAGGTDVLPSLKQRIIKTEYLVDLKKIPDLSGINYSPDSGLRIGSLTTLRALQASNAVQEHYTALAEASHAVGALQHQNMGTIGGNICQETRCWFYNQSDFWRKSRAVCRKLGGEVCHVVKGGDKCFAAYQGDTAPALMAWGAQIILHGKDNQTRTIPLKEFFTGEGKPAFKLGPTEVLTQIIIPPPPSSSASNYQKLRLRESIDFPLASAAVTLSLESGNGKIKDIRAILGAVGSSPIELEELPSLLKGNTLTDELIEKATQEAVKKAHPVANTVSTPDYRKKMAGVMLKRALKAAYEQAKK